MGRSFSCVSVMGLPARLLAKMKRRTEAKKRRRNEGKQQQQQQQHTHRQVQAETEERVGAGRGKKSRSKMQCFSGLATNLTDGNGNPMPTTLGWAHCTALEITYSRPLH